MGGRGGVGKLNSSGILRGLGYKKGKEGFADKLAEAKEGMWWTPRERLEYSINPEHAKGMTIQDHELYKTNCALCTTALALNQMGYDVEALPRDVTQWRGSTTIFNIDYSDYTSFVTGGDVANYTSLHVDGDHFFDAYLNPNVIASSSSLAQAKDIVNVMKSWGPNSFADISLAWKSGGAHSEFLFCDKSGNVHLFDGQTGDIFHGAEAIAKELSHAKLKETLITRLDNVSFKPNIAKELKKMVKKSTWRTKWANWDKEDKGNFELYDEFIVKKS